MFERLHETIGAHAVAAWPEAVCGAVYGDEGSCVYRPLADVADSSRLHFRLDVEAPGALEAAHGKLAAVVLSHPRPEKVTAADGLLHTPSAAEMRAQLALAVPFGVVVCDRTRVVELFWFGDACPMQPLLGRPFRHGVMDCYSIIRDWFRLERDVVLREFPRDWNWWIEGQDLYETGFAQAGGRLVAPEEAGEKGDVVLFRMRSKVPNHGAVLLGDGRMLHHPGSLRPYDPMRVSHIVPMERWARHATHWIRHGSPG